MKPRPFFVDQSFGEDKRVRQAIIFVYHQLRYSSLDSDILFNYRLEISCGRVNLYSNNITIRLRIFCDAFISTSWKPGLRPGLQNPHRRKPGSPSSSSTLKEHHPKGAPSAGTWGTSRTRMATNPHRREHETK